MHELSVARNIIETVEQNVPADERKSVKAVVLKAGEFSGVVTDSLKFSWEAIVHGTPLQGSELIIEPVPFRLKCNVCGSETGNVYGLRECSECRSMDTNVIQGEELIISEIVLDDKT